MNNCKPTFVPPCIGTEMAVEFRNRPIEWMEGEINYSNDPVNIQEISMI